MTKRWANLADDPFARFGRHGDAGPPALTGPGIRPPFSGRLVLMLSANLLSALVFTALSPVLPEIAAYFGGDDSGTFMAQMAMSAPGAGVIIGGLLGGLIIGKAGLPPTLFVALGCFAVVGSAPLYVNSSEALLASRFLLGACDAVIQTSLMTLISLSFSDEQRVRLIGYATAIGYCGAILSVLASGALGEMAGWRAPGLLYLFALPLLVLALFTVRAVPQASREERVAGSQLVALKSAWRTFLIIPPTYAVNYMLAIQFAFLLQANGISSPAEKSWIMGAGMVMAIGGAAASGRLRERLGQQRLLGMMALLLGAGQAIIGLSTGVPGTLIGAAIAGLAGGMVLPTFVNTVISQVPLSVRSVAIGLVYSTAYVGEFLNPVLLDPIRRVIGIHGVFMAVGSVVAAIGVCVILMARPRAMPHQRRSS